MTPNRAGDPSSSRVSDTLFCAAMILAITAAVAWLSLEPFEWSRPGWERLKSAVSPRTLLLDPPILKTLFERLPFAAIGAFCIPLMPAWSFRRRIMSAAFVAAIIAGGIEFLQLFASGRHARWSDLLTALIFGAAGAALTAILARRMKPSHYRASAVASIVIAALAISWVVMDSNQRRSLSAWDCSAPINIANEADGLRPWLGTIHAARIATDGNALDLLEAADLKPPVVITPPDSLSAKAEGLSLCEAIKTNHAFELEVTLTRDGRTQTGPARIISWSNDIYDQNILLREQDGRFVLRLAQGRQRLARHALDLSLKAASTEGQRTVRAGFDRGRVWLADDTGRATAYRLDRNVYVSPGRRIPQLIVVLGLIFASVCIALFFWKKGRDLADQARPAS